MENNLDFATIGASAPDTYDNPILQGSSDLDYQPTSTRPAPPAPAAAASHDTKDQAARLRALLSSHLSEGGANNGHSTSADRLEALIDMLYAMTAPAAVASSPAPAAVASSPAPAAVASSPAPTETASVAAPVAAEEKPALAPVAQSHTITHTEPVENALISAPFSAPGNVSTAPALVPAPVEAPAAQLESPVTHSEAPAALLTETASAPDLHTPSVVTSLVTEPETVAEPVTAPVVVAETQTAPHFAAPESAVETHPQETHPQEATTQEAPQTEVPQEYDTLLETPPAAKEAEPAVAVEPSVAPAVAATETFSAWKLQAIHAPTASVTDVSEVSPTLSPINDTVAVDTKAAPRAHVAMAEVLTMDERAALLNPMKQESVKEAPTTAPGGITFNFVTEKSTATLNIPIQLNLSQITFEHRPDEIILKIHLSL